MPTPETTQPDQTLARAAADGDRAAFEAIIRRYSGPLARFAAGKTGTVQDAEDIVQETFLRAYLNLGQFNPQYSLKNWLFTIAYRLIVSEYRKKMPASVDAGVLAEVAEENADPAAPMEWLWDQAEQMGREFYTVLWLRYKEAMEITDIAQVMGKTKIGVRVLLHRARRRLAERLERPCVSDVSGRQAYRHGVWIERTEHV